VTEIDGHRIAADILRFMDGERIWLAGDDVARWWQETGEFELCQLLHWAWDPIGVASAFPWAADEYDFYVPPIADALNGHASTDLIFDMLRSIETERMAMPDSDAAAETRRKAAAAIVEWHGNSQQRWRQFGALPR
jgi:hypothetical protein